MTDIMQKAVEAGAREVCRAHGWDADAPVEYARTSRKVKDKDGSFVLQWRMHEDDARSAIEAALRVLSAEAVAYANPALLFDPAINNVIAAKPDHPYAGREGHWTFPLFLAPQPAAQAMDLEQFRPAVVAMMQKASDGMTQFLHPCSDQERECYEAAASDFEKADRLLALIDAQRDGGA